MTRAGNWITIKTGLRWEVEFMQQILAAQEIATRIISQGAYPHFGCGALAALQVQSQDRWTALLLLSPREEEIVPNQCSHEDVT
ncbi:MAG: hypothetical protein ACFB5Z_14970 [Elainellaceae cyanobacterium]